MKLARILCWLLFPLVVGVVQSCCYCEGEVEYKFEVSSTDVYNLDNSGIEPKITDADTISKAAYGIELKLTTAKITKADVHPFSFINSASAMKCVCYSFSGTSKDSVLSIKIFTVNDFDTSHKAGSDVTAIFYSDGKNPMPPGGNYNQPLYSSAFKPDALVYKFLLMQSPSNPSCQFHVVLNLGNQRIIDLLTKPVTLQ